MTHNIDITNSSLAYQAMPLENRYGDLIFQFDPNKKCDFQDYHRTVNEWPPQKIQPHLHQMKPGVTVVAGAERGFFDLLLSDEALCEGVIFRDINPKVKAYVDCNILLLRISQNIHEYAELSEPFAWYQDNYETLMAKRIEIITDKTRKSDLPEHVKNYYLKHMRSLCYTYLDLGRRTNWREQSRLSACFYHKDEKQFSKLQRYAKSGNIIATIGDISDLRFLKDTNISIVDTSNIHEYCVVNLQGEGNFSPKVIWTELSKGETKYYSDCYVWHKPLNTGEEAEFQKLVKLFQQTHTDPNRFYFQIMKEKLHLADSSLCNNPQEVFQKLKKYITQNVIPNPDLHIIEEPTLGYRSLSNIPEINLLSVEQFTLLCSHPQISQHLPFLLGQTNSLKPEHYLALLKIPGAKEEFEKKCIELQIDLRHFENSLADAFSQEFGRTRFAKLKEKVALARFRSDPIETVRDAISSLAPTVKVGLLMVGVATAYMAVFS